MAPRSTNSPWRQKRDPLWRGDSIAGLADVDPAADRSIVRHVLYLDGAGRATPYHSTTEEHAVAGRFAGSAGRVYQTTVSQAAENGVAHIPRLELIRLLKGNGQGDARWPNAFEVMQARKYVELWGEHLLNYSGIDSATDANAVAKRTLK